jgi:nucleoside 2-deoxyribosyltransferase
MAQANQSLKCFVASAFGHDDVDAVYDQVIMPVLSNLGIRALRVDRVEHNDDIDDKILALIGDCDFCIADLTYARPSVYFEAGRVTGLGKPVIYTARSDHFRDQPDDDAGNLRVHFDLQMKNVIAWARPSTVVQKALTSRIRLVTRPLIAERRSRETEELERKRFNESSLHDRVAELRKLARSALRSADYVVLSDVYFPGTVAFRLLDNRSETVVVYIAQSFTKRDLQFLMSSIALSKTWSMMIKKAGVSAPSLHACDVICVSAQPIPVSRVLDVRRSFSVAESGSVYRETAALERPKRATALHTLCPKSFQAFRQMMTQHCAELGQLGPFSA